MMAIRTSSRPASIRAVSSSTYNIRVDPPADSQVGGGNKTKATTARRYWDESREVVSYRGSLHAFLSQTHPPRIAADQPAVVLQRYPRMAALSPGKQGGLSAGSCGDAAGSL